MTMCPEILVQVASICNINRDANAISIIRQMRPSKDVEMDHDEEGVEQVETTSFEDVLSARWKLIRIQQ